MAIANAKLHKAVGKLFATATGTFHSLVVSRGGTATQREMVVDHKIRLKWRPDGTSVPINVPAGKHVLHGFVKGTPGATWGFVLVSPHQEPLRGGKLSTLGVEAFDKTVTVP